jgi:hypothetical protein
MKYRFEVRKFNELGLEKFRDLLTGRPTQLFKKLDELAEDPATSEALGADFEWDSRLSDRFDLAQRLWEIFGVGKALEREAGEAQVWNWLSCKLFPILQQGQEKEARANTKESLARWIMTENSLRQHRHLVSGPFVAYKNNFGNLDGARSQLVQPILEPGEVVERIAGKLELSQGSVALLSTWLYVDPTSRKIRPGITSQGEPQQFSKYFNQIQKTVDYESMTAKELFDMLPKTFDHWKQLAKQDYKF